MRVAVSVGENWAEKGHRSCDRETVQCHRQLCDCPIMPHSSRPCEKAKLSLLSLESNSNPVAKSPEQYATCKFVTKGAP